MHRDWDKLATFYGELALEIPQLQASLDGLAALCRSISKSHLREGLFAHTSMRDLCIAQTKTDYPPQLTMQWLVIEPLSAGGLEFSLKGDPKGRDGKWHRKVASHKVVPNFNKFLRQLGWNYHPIPE